jgi:hypothetical protein
MAFLGACLGAGLLVGRLVKDSADGSTDGSSGARSTAQLPAQAVAEVKDTAAQGAQLHRVARVRIDQAPPRGHGIDRSLVGPGDGAP